MPSLVTVAVPVSGPQKARVRRLGMMVRLEPVKLTWPVSIRSTSSQPNWKSPLTTIGLATVRYGVA